MQARRRTLVAAQPGAWSVLQRILDEFVEPDVALIISTIAFDDSRMVEFLRAVKRNPPTREIPFLCSRVLPNALPDNLVPGLRNLCKQCGAVDLVDIAGLDPGASRGALCAAIRACLQ
jgi:hypothetical protein